MEENNVKKKIVMIIALGIVMLALGVGGVYAYFAATVTQDTTSNVTISAVSGLAISFSNSANIEIENALPGQSWTKTFSATLTNNTSEIPIAYSVKLHITSNTFQSGEGYLTYTLTGAENKTEAQITEQSGDIVVVENKTIKGNKNTNEVVHTYTLTISYPNNPNSVQQQGGVFNGYIYFETGNNQISGGVKLYNHEGTSSKQKSDLEIGDIVKIGTEEFYIITDEKGNIIDSKNKVRALAKYNLLIGRKYTSESKYEVIDGNETFNGDIVGLQSSQALGIRQANVFESVGTVAFSDNDNVGTNCASNLKIDGKCYTTYESSLVEMYVNKYVDYLKLFYGNTLTGTLITKRQLEWLKIHYTGDINATIGYEVMNNWDVSNTIYDKPTWLWATSYWTKTPHDSSRIWKSRYAYGSLIFYLDKSYSSPNELGVRPVIEFSL